MEPELLLLDAADIAGVVVRPSAPVEEPNRSLPTWYIQAMELAAERLGGDTQRWETLVGLLEDYEGSFEELVELAEAI